MNVKHIAILTIFLLFDNSFCMKTVHYLNKNENVRKVITLLYSNQATQANIDEAEIQLQAMEDASRKKGHINRHTEQLRKDFEAAKKVFNTIREAENIKRELEVIKEQSSLAPIVARRLPPQAPRIPRVPARNQAQPKANNPLNQRQIVNALMNQTEADLSAIEGFILAREFDAADEKLNSSNLYARFDRIRYMVARPTLKTMTTRINRELRNFILRLRAIEKELAQ